MAKEKGLSMISITDHDGVDGVSEGVLEGEKLGIKVIPGIEISVKSDIRGLHILGYGIDIKNKRFNAFINELKQFRKERNEKLIQEFINMGINITNNELQYYNTNGYWGRPHFAQILKNRGHVKNIREAFTSDEYFRADHIRRIVKEKPDDKQGIQEILNSGGFPVLAHPGLVKNNNGKEMSYIELNSLIVALKSKGLKGVECYYSEHTKEFTKEIIKIALANNMFLTAGSDFHGNNNTKESKRHMGLNIEYKNEIEKLKFPF
jgi:predicted metal-dependent phosphoesterase TrpH